MSRVARGEYQGETRQLSNSVPLRSREYGGSVGQNAARSPVIGLGLVVRLQVSGRYLRGSLHHLHSPAVAVERKGEKVDSQRAACN